MLRLESCGHLELWSVRDCVCLCTLSAEFADPIISCCPLLNSPFALVGLGSGTLQCCAFVNAAGEHVGPARPIQALQWMPFQVATANIHVQDDSELQHVTSMQRRDGEVRALLLHEFHTVTAMSMVSGEVRSPSSCMHVPGNAMQNPSCYICFIDTKAHVLSNHLPSRRLRVCERATGAEKCAVPLVPFLAVLLCWPLFRYILHPLGCR